MTLYLDTSAFVKLYVVETLSDVAERAVASSEQLLISILAYPESRAALARRQREGFFDRDQLDRAVADLDRDWESYTRIGVSESLAILAGNLADLYSLRGYDAVHLASALLFRERERETTFLTFDRRLYKAARKLMPCYVVPELG